MEAVEVYSGGEDSDFELDENSLRELYKADSVSDKSTTSSIKDELRTKIQQRRISEGQEELKIEFEPPKSYKLTPEERGKIENRKRRNRQSANSSRIKRQRRLENLLADEKNISAENQRLRVEVDALGKFKVKLETVLQNHLARCNMKDNPSSGRFITLLRDTNSAYIPADGNVVGPASTNSLTDAIQPYVRTGYVPSSLTEETNFKNIGDEQLVNRGQNLRQRTFDRTYLSNMSKEQKISMLKAYLKGNQYKPEVQRLIGQISQMTRAEHTMQQV